ncbi:hypothetical protein T484DRAFT_2263095 [Baffinella frigidus]|nr:hypothetical protein T484DRAFT_2263095 [Cryptophyta sp. CCMP2293]
MGGIRRHSFCNDISCSPPTHSPVSLAPIISVITALALSVIPSTHSPATQLQRYQLLTHQPVVITWEVGTV